MTCNFKICKTDRDWIDETYPDLHIDDGKQEIKGRIHLKREWKGIWIEKDIRIRIPLARTGKSSLPTCFVDAAFIDGIKEKHCIDQLDLHVYHDYSLCILLKPLEVTSVPQPFTFKFYLYDLIEVQLYWLGYYEQYGKEPWPGYDHGTYGYLEAFVEGKIALFQLKAIVDQDKDIDWMKLIDLDRRSQCICGSGRLARKCHRSALNAAGKIRSKLNDRLQ